MLKVRQVARALKISDTQLRNWGNEFAGFLSPGANPGKNKVRLYSEDDLAVLQTVAVLRSQETSYDDIHAALDAGERLELASFQESPATDDKPPTQTETAITIYEAFAETLQLYESRVVTYESRVEELTDRLLAAEIRASEAETRLKVLQEMSEENVAQGENITWWDRLFGRGGDSCRLIGDGGFLASYF